MEKIKSYISIFKNVDIFGVPIQLFFNEKRKYKSYFGALISTAVLSLSLYILLSQIMSWLNIENSSTIYSVENFSVQNLLNQNRSLEYNLTNMNYNIYFVVRADLPNGTILRNGQLSRYFTLNYKYTEDADTMVDYKIIETEPCNVRDANKFIMLEYDESVIAENKTNPNRMCVKGSLMMGLKAEFENQNVKRPGLSFQISQCNDSSKNGISCASDNEIKEMMKYIIVQASIPQTLYDFKNNTQTIKRLFKYEIYRLDWNLKKLLTYDINPIFLYKDHGYFTDDYQLDSVNFNPSQQTFDINSKNTDEIIFQYDLRMSMQIEKYFIRNEKINSIMSDFGGMINFLYTMGYLLCFYLNRALFTRTLVRSTFDIESHNTRKIKVILSKNANKKGSKLIENRSYFLNKPKNNWIFPISFVLKCFKSARGNKQKDLFEKSKELLYEYIDLKNVINRLQDVDKIKNILFTESQRFFFDLIPKPKVRYEERKKGKKSSFSAHLISKTRTKNLSNKLIFENFNEINQKGFTQMDERIFLFLSDSTKKKINLQASTNNEKSTAGTNSKYGQKKENLINKNV